MQDIIIVDCNWKRSKVSVRFVISSIDFIHYHVIEVINIVFNDSSWLGGNAIKIRLYVFLIIADIVDLVKLDYLNGIDLKILSIRIRTYEKRNRHIADHVVREHTYLNPLIFQSNRMIRHLILAFAIISQNNQISHHKIRPASNVHSDKLGRENNLRAFLICEPIDCHLIKHSQI